MVLAHFISVASAICGVVRPLAEVQTRSRFDWDVGFEDGVVMRRGGEGGDRYCMDKETYERFVVP